MCVCVHVFLPRHVKTHFEFKINRHRAFQRKRACDRLAQRAHVKLNARRQLDVANDRVCMDGDENVVSLLLCDVRARNERMSNNEQMEVKMNASE